MPNDLELRLYAAGFFDVMGQRNAFTNLKRAWQQQREQSHPTPELIHAMKMTVGQVLGVRSLFDNYLSAEDLNFSEPAANLPDEHLPLIADLKSTPLNSIPLSDAIVVFVPVATPKGIPSGVGIYRLLRAAAACMLTTLASKAAIRGAIDIDVGIQLGESDFYGPALGNAYQMESKEADWPRILISESVVEFLHAPNSNNSLADQISDRFRDLSRDLIFEDTDGRHALDYLGSGAQRGVTQVVDDDLDFDLIATNAYVFCQSMTQAANISEKIRRKYQHALAYFTSRLGTPSAERRKSAAAYREKLRTSAPKPHPTE